MHHERITYSAGVSFRPSPLVVCPPAPDTVFLHVGLPSSRSFILQHFCTGPRLFPILSLHWEPSSHSFPSSSMWSSSPSWPFSSSFLEHGSGFLLLEIPSFDAFIRRHSSSELLDRLNVLQVPLRPSVLLLADLCFSSAAEAALTGNGPMHVGFHHCEHVLSNFEVLEARLPVAPSPTLPMCKHLPNGCQSSAK